MDYHAHAKTSCREENDRIKYAVSCMKGTRDEMQDYHTTIPELDGSNPTSFFGVFDGHGGDKVALYCSKRFHLELVNDPDYENNPRTAMENVVRIDKKLKRSDRWRTFDDTPGPVKRNLLNRLKSAVSQIFQPYKGPQKEGSTACVAHISGNQIIVGNVGYSGCVLSRNGQAIDLSTDHKPDDPDERKIYEAARGKAVQDRVPKIDKPTGEFCGIEPGGEIAISRAIGDSKFKKKNLAPARQKLTCNPDIRTEDMTDDFGFLLIASDGICKSMTRQKMTHKGPQEDPPVPRATTASSKFQTKLKLNGLLYSNRRCIGYNRCHRDSNRNNIRQLGTEAFSKEQRSKVHNDNTQKDEHFEKLRNTVTLCLDGSDEEVLKSYLAALTHLRLWNVQNGTEVNFESILGYCAKTYTTAFEGTFYLVVTYKNRSITLVIDARTGWLCGYIGPRGIFQFRKSTSSPEGTLDYINHVIAQILSIEGSYEFIAPMKDVSQIEVGLEPLRASQVKLADHQGGEEDSEFQTSFGVIVFGLLEAFKSHTVSGLVARTIKEGISTRICNSSNPSQSKIVKKWGKGSTEANEVLFSFLRDGPRRSPVLLKKMGDIITIDGYVQNTLFCPAWSALKHAYPVSPIKIARRWYPIDERAGDPSVHLLSEYDRSSLSASELIAFDRENELFFGHRAGGPPHPSVSSIMDAILLPDCYIPWWNPLPVKIYQRRPVKIYQRRPVNIYQRRLPTDQQLRGDLSSFYGFRDRGHNIQQKRSVHSWSVNFGKRALRYLKK